MTYKELKNLLAAALDEVNDEDADVIVIDENDVEYDIGEVSDDAGESFVLFVQTTPGGNDD